MYIGMRGIHAARSVRKSVPALCEAHTVLCGFNACDDFDFECTYNVCFQIFLNCIELLIHRGCCYSRINNPIHSDPFKNIRKLFFLFTHSATNLDTYDGTSDNELS